MSEPKSHSSVQIPCISWLAVMRETLTAIHEVHAAFGAPGDYGYESKEGKALERLYDSTRGLCAEIATNTPTQTREASSATVGSASTMPSQRVNPPRQNCGPR